MQRSWRQDPDKLTFITCRPIPEPAVPTTARITEKDDYDSLDRMLGDINLFLRVDEGDEQPDEEQDAKKNAPMPQIIGEVELMIAEKTNHRKGFGRAALLCFLRYIVEHEVEILTEFVPSTFTTSGQKMKIREKDKSWRFSALSAKIGKDNVGSLALFESVGFRRVSEKPNCFGELELLLTGFDHSTVNKELEKARIEGYAELDYARREMS